MTNNIFMVRNMFCPYKDYSSFLGGELKMFKLCNYDLCWQRYDVIFGIVPAYFIIYEAYFFVSDFLYNY
jgi:hypothetical protein